MKECNHCLMNSKVDPEIQFDENGICNYCTEYFEAHEVQEKLIADGYFEKQIQKIKRSRSPYDCILGISGGTDSSYVAYLLHKKGLNVLMVHCDNGWDRETAISNLAKIKKETGFDLCIRKVDTEAFFAAQRSLLKARVVDIELLSDHINIASIYEVAMKKKIPWMVTGENIHTEFFMPNHWVHNKNDWRQIADINNRFEKADLSSFPKLGPIRKFLINKRLKTKYFTPLNCMHYNKVDAHEKLMKVFDWQDHGGKHFESSFTIFYQCYILPTFFNIDKRIPHLSNLICANILTKEKARELLSEEIIKPDLLAEIKEKVFSKLNLSEKQFNEIMAKPRLSHSHYNTHFVYNPYFQKLLTPLR